MLVVMSQQATSEEIDAVVAAIEAKGYSARPIPGGEDGYWCFEQQGGC